MQYEGTKAEIAKGFKEQGNEMVKTKQWKDAKEFYAKGIAVLTTKGADDKWEKPGDPELEVEKEKELEEQIYVNRALCNLELGTDHPPLAQSHSINKSYRKLPPNNPRLSRCPPPKSHKHQSPLPLLHCPPIP